MEDREIERRRRGSGGRGVRDEKGGLEGGGLDRRVLLKKERAREELGRASEIIESEKRRLTFPKVRKSCLEHDRIRLEHRCESSDSFVDGVGSPVLERARMDSDESVPKRLCEKGRRKTESAKLAFV